MKSYPAHIEGKYKAEEHKTVYNRKNRIGNDDFFLRENEQSDNKIYGTVTKPLCKAKTEGLKKDYELLCYRKTIHIT